jgi:hypothetical protein
MRARSTEKSVAIAPILAPMAGEGQWNFRWPWATPRFPWSGRWPCSKSALQGMLATLITTLLIAGVYLFVVRLIDMNEKEPWWAMAMLFVFGVVASVALLSLAPATVTELSALGSAVTKAGAKFLAIGAGVGALVLYGQRRGWEEFNGTMDGIVYGTCGGFGFGIGEQLVHELRFGAVALPGADPGLFAGFGTRLFGGLSDGVIGALIGIGFGAAAELRSPILRAGLPVFGVLAGVAGELAYFTLRYGNSLGDSGALRATLALYLPLLAIALIAVYALVSERRAIALELPSEAQVGTVSAEDLAALGSVVRRQGTYLKALASGSIGRLLSLRALHNLQVQLAFIKRRAATERDAARRAELDAELGRVREAVLACKRRLGTGGSA